MVSGGYVKYNISPAFNKAIGVGDVITISGELKNGDTRNDYVEVLLGGTFLVDTALCVRFTKKAAKNVAASFSTNFTVTQGMIDTIFSTPPTADTRQAYLFFILYENGGGGSYPPPYDNQKYTVIKVRAYPDIEDFDESDRKFTTSGESSLLEYFGNYVQGESLPSFTMTFITDPRDEKITTTHTLTVKDSNDNVVAEVSGAAPALATTMTLDIPPITTPGRYSYHWILMESTGWSAEAQGHFNVVAYSPPSITNWVVERYRTVVGEPDPVPAPDGDHVMLSIDGSVSEMSVPSQWATVKNAWTLVLRWGESGGTMTDVTLASGNNGRAISYTRDDTLLTTQVSLSSIYEFTAILTDKIGQTAQTYEVPKATCYLNIEKNGIGIGMYTVGTASDKRVDIADDYTLHANGDALFGGNVAVTGNASVSGSAAFGGNVAVGAGKLIKVVNVALASSKSISGGAVGEYNAAVNPGTGWTPVCTVGTRCNNGRIVMRRVYVSGSNAYVEAFNTGTSSATVSISADVLCIRTSL